MQDTLDRLARLPIRYACSGHGAAMDNPKASLDAARRRYDKWFAEPEKLAWHACKRIFTYALMLSNGMTLEEIPSYLSKVPGFKTLRATPSSVNRAISYNLS